MQADRSLSLIVDPDQWLRCAHHNTALLDGGGVTLTWSRTRRRLWAVGCTGAARVGLRARGARRRPRVRPVVPGLRVAPGARPGRRDELAGRH